MEQTDITAIDWPTERANSILDYDLDDQGLPVNPVQPDLPDGPNRLPKWGENQAGDAIVLAELDREQHVLLIQRGDNGTWAIPGGMLNGPQEDPLDGALRELLEETGLKVDAGAVTWEDLEVRYVLDPRATKRSWVVTWPYLINLGEVVELPKVTGGDDARRAEWVRADSFDHLVDELAALGGEVFRAHVDMLRDVLG